MSQFFVYAIPVFAALILIEFIYGILKGRNTYRLNDTISSLSQGLLSQVVAALTPLFQIGLYSLVFSKFHDSSHNEVWQTWSGVALAVVLYDFTDYWLHRTGHECNLFWAAHIVHHQSEQYNLSTALRQESLYPIAGCVFFFPMALLGIPPDVFAVAGLIVLLYQFWIHTEHVGKLGWFDLVFTSPSNHRVHHSINAQYIDKNYGAILIIWDRLFGTFEPEGETCAYGTLTPLNSWSPLKAVSCVFTDMAEKTRDCTSWADKLRILYKYPGWMPGKSTANPQVNINPGSKYDPVVSNKMKLSAVLLFILALIVCLPLMLDENDISYPGRIIMAIIVVTTLWLSGKMLSARQFTDS